MSPTPVHHDRSTWGRPTGRRLSPADLSVLVDHVAAAEALWMHLVVHDAKARSTLRLIATDHHEAGSSAGRRGYAPNCMTTARPTAFRSSRAR